MEDIRKIEARTKIEAQMCVLRLIQDTPHPKQYSHMAINIKKLMFIYCKFFHKKTKSKP